VIARIACLLFLFQGANTLDPSQLSALFYEPDGPPHQATASILHDGGILLFLSNGRWLESSDAAIVRIKPDGSVAWAQRLSSKESGKEFLVTRLAEDASGRLILAGCRWTSEETGVDAMIRVLSPDGAPIWERDFAFQGANYHKGATLDPRLSRRDYFNALTVTKSGDIVATAWADFGNLGEGRGLGASVIRLTRNGALRSRRDWNPKSSYFGATAWAVYPSPDDGTLVLLNAPTRSTGRLTLTVQKLNADGIGQPLAVRESMDGFKPDDVVPDGRGGYFALSHRIADRNARAGGDAEAPGGYATWMHLDSHLNTTASRQVRVSEYIAWTFGRSGQTRWKLDTEPPSALAPGGRVYAATEVSVPVLHRSGEAPPPPGRQWRLFSFDARTLSTLDSSADLVKSILGYAMKLVAQADGSVVLIATPGEAGQPIKLIIFRNGLTNPKIIAL
jgi:hypothetical protein